jgi:hypothetical protein
MAFYKFMHRPVRDFVAQGSLRLGRLGHYQMLEIVTQDRWIGDAMEATESDTIEGLTVTDSSPAEDRERFKDFGIHVQAGSVSVGKMTRFDRKDAFVFCFSEGDLDSLVSSMSSPDKKDYAYDGCVTIVDPKVLSDRIAEALLPSGDKVNSRFRVLFDKVKYSDSRTLNSASRPVISFFKKGTAYEGQHEWRVVLDPIAESINDRDYIDINISSAGLLEAVDINVELPETNAPLPEDLTVVLDRLQRYAQLVMTVPGPSQAHDRIQVIRDYWTLKMAGIVRYQAFEDQALDGMPDFFLQNRLLLEMRIMDIKIEG